MCEAWNRFLTSYLAQDIKDTRCTVQSNDLFVISKIPSRGKFLLGLILMQVSYQKYKVNAKIIKNYIYKIIMEIPFKSNTIVYTLLSKVWSQRQVLAYYCRKGHGRKYC